MEYRSKWSDIRGEYFDEDEGVQFIDAWLTDNADEEGTVIAKIHFDTKEVEYLDDDARYDYYAQEVISQ